MRVESPLLSLSFFLLSSHSWNSFNRYHFCIYIHVYAVSCQSEITELHCSGRTGLEGYFLSPRKVFEVARRDIRALDTEELMGETWT
jgi:hypothetical protein